MRKEKRNGGEKRLWIWWERGQNSGGCWVEAEKCTKVMASDQMWSVPGGGSVPRQKDQVSDALRRVCFILECSPGTWVKNKQMARNKM